MKYRFAMLAAAIGLTLNGCAETSGPGSGRLEPGDFRASEPVGAMTVVPTDKPRLEGVPIHPSQAEEHLVDIGTLIGPPPDPSPTPPLALAQTEPVVLDSLVGQINGRPVYASEFLGPLGASLRGLALETKDENAWRAKAAESIYKVLKRRLRDELLITESQSSFTPEQKKGLLHFVQAIREDLVSNAGGGAAVAADEAYRERKEGQGRGLDEEVKSELDQEMVRLQVRTKVIPLANVSWRDVQLEYNRRYAEFNPPATAMFRVIYIPDSKPDVLSEFTRRIEAGEGFAPLASLPENDFLSKEGGQWARQFGRGFAEGIFFQDREYNDAAHQLRPGQTSPPIHIKNRTAWVHLDGINSPPGKPLYDVQVRLYNELREERLQEEAERYVTRLENKGSFSDVQSMVRRLLAIAHERYFVAQK